MMGWSVSIRSQDKCDRRREIEQETNWKSNKKRDKSSCSENEFGLPEYIEILLSQLHLHSFHSYFEDRSFLRYRELPKYRFVFLSSENIISQQDNNYLTCDRDNDHTEKGIDGMFPFPTCTNMDMALFMFFLELWFSIITASSIKFLK